MSTPRTRRFSETDVARLAAEWVARRDRGLTALEQDSLIAWQNADPRNAAELKRLEQTWRGLDAVGEVHELDAMADAFVTRARTRRARRRLRFASLAFAAAATIAVGFTSWNAYAPAGREHQVTRSNEHYRVLESTVQRMDLPDGSVAELNGASRIEVDFTPTTRRVTLTQGEAHFIVASNPERPFFVTAGPVTVRAVGTAFNVRFDAASIEVLVTEGKVSLENANAARSPTGAEGVAESPALIQGQRAVIDLAPAATKKVSVGEVGPAEMDDALGWQSTRLVFNNTPLGEVVEGFNRYNSHQLTIGDPKLRQRTLTGVFRADNLDGFVRLLQASVDVRAKLRSSTETVLLPVR